MTGSLTRVVAIRDWDLPDQLHFEVVASTKLLTELTTLEALLATAAI